MAAVRELIDHVQQLVRRYHADAGFKAEMDSDPLAVLQREGFGKVLPGVAQASNNASVRLHVDDESTMHIVFPKDAGAVSLNDQGLGDIAGGACSMYASGGCAISTVSFERSRP